MKFFGVWMCRRHERDADDLILQAILEIRSGLAVEDWKESLEAAQPDIDIDPEDPDPNSEWRTGLDHWVCLTITQNDEIEYGSL